MRRVTFRRPRLPRSRRGQRRLVQAVMAGCVLALLPATWMYTVTGDRLRTAADVPRTEVAVVFGAGLWDGEPSPYLAHRLDAAAKLYREGRVKVVLVTGDNSREDYDEPDAMRVYLTRHGVPDGRIVSDYAGFDTWDSCVRAKKIFGVDAVHDATWYYGGTREIFAAGKAALDAVFRPDPRFLGPREPGVERALAAAEDPLG